MNRAATVVGSLLLLAVLCWFIPLIHLVRLDQAPTEKPAATFDAATFARAFWSEHLLPSHDHAADAAAVIAALRDDQKHAREQFGRTVGLSRSTLFYLRGEGTVVAIDKNSVGIAVGGGEQPNLLFRTGPLFGNTVRDATGLLDAGAFANSQQFNEISTELNRVVEEQVLSKLKEGAKVGQKIEFLACAERTGDLPAGKPLAAVPLSVTFP